MRNWLVIAALWLGACGDPAANCEVEVNGVTVCVGGASTNYCEKEWDGTATEADSSDDATCESLGYAVSCTGTVEETGENFTASHAFQAASEEDCTAADGGSLGG